MALLKIENTFSWLQTDNDVVKERLWRALRFRDPSCFFNPRYKARIWDGYHEYFKRNTGRFLTGLLPEVLQALAHFRQDYQKRDMRQPFSFRVPSVDENFVPGIKLRDYQVANANLAIRRGRGIVFAPTSAGKAQPLDSTVWTPNGPVKMGSLRVGDKICRPQGGFATVVGVFPQGKKEVFEVEFSNGDKVRCCDDHLWTVDSPQGGWTGKTMPLKELRGRIRLPAGRCRFLVRTGSADFYPRPVPIDPYLLGTLLGDGHLKGTPRLSTADQEVLAWAGSAAESFDLSAKTNDGLDYRLSGTKGKSNKLKAELVGLDLWGKRAWEKSIPEAYLFNTRAVRAEILRGLLDTDGYIDSKGHMEYGSTSRLMAEQVHQLAASLGLIATAVRKGIRKSYRYRGENRKGRPYFILSIRGNIPEAQFNIARKASRKRVTGYGYNRYICNVRMVGEAECQCIMVDADDGLYLTDGFVPTHNTAIAQAIANACPEDAQILAIGNKKDLADQNYEAFVQAGLKGVGRLYNGIYEPQRIMCATWQSCHKIAEWLPSVQVLLVDEVHDLMSAGAKQVYRVLTNAGVRIAFSATPFKNGGRDPIQRYDVKGWMGPEFILPKEIVPDGRLNTKVLQERGFVSSCDCTFYRIGEPDLGPYVLYQDAVTQGIAENAYFHDVVSRLAKKRSGRTLIIVERIAHGDHLLDRIPNAVWVRGQDNMKTRKEVIRRLKHEKGDIVAIATAGIFNTGINCFVHNLINAAGGKADHTIVQRLGRGLRLAEDKDNLLYTDFLFTNNQYLEKHSDHRVKVIEGEGHTVTVKDIDF